MNVVCMNFVTELANSIVSMPIIHSDKMHKSLLQLSKLILEDIKNDHIEVNDPRQVSEIVRAILEFFQMITKHSVEKNPEIAKFFIEEASTYGKSRGTQTYVPIQVLIEFLKKEQIEQGQHYKFMLRELLLRQLKIKNDKVRRFIVLESDFALNVMGKFTFYLQVLPQEISLIRLSDSEYPEDEVNIYANIISLQRQIYKNCSKKILESFAIFSQYVSFINELCETAESSGVHYDSQGKKLVLIDQICFNFTSDILVGHFEPMLLTQTQHVPLIRTSYQIFLHILENINSPVMVMAMFQFIFGEAQPAQGEKQIEQSDEYYKNALNELEDDEPVDLLGDSGRDSIQDVSPDLMNEDKPNPMSL